MSLLQVSIASFTETLNETAATVISSSTSSITVTKVPVADFGSDDVIVTKTSTETTEHRGVVDTATNSSSLLEAIENVQETLADIQDLCYADNVSIKLESAERLYRDEKLLEAARILRTIEDATLLDGVHTDILMRAVDCEDMVSNLKSNLDHDPWTKQGETTTSSLRPTTVHYKFDEETGTKLTARLETPIEKSLLVPLLSVLNESELYPTWLPDWTYPRLRVKTSTKLQQSGRASQIIVLRADMPWPMSPREIVLSAFAFDDIDTNCEIAIRLKSLNTGEENGLVPPPSNNCQRIDAEGGFLIRPCPPDRASSSSLARETEEQDSNEVVVEKKEEEILVSFLMYADAKMPVIPQPVINFVLRTVMGMMWNMFLKVAEDVRDGKLPGHANAIQQKRDSLYDWVDSRVEAMFDLLRRKSQ